MSITVFIGEDFWGNLKSWKVGEGIMLSLIFVGDGDEVWWLEKEEWVWHFLKGGRNGGNN